MLTCEWKTQQLGIIKVDITAPNFKVSVAAVAK